MRRHVWRPSLAAVLIVALAACSSGGDDDAAPTTRSTTTSTTAATSTTGDITPVDRSTAVWPVEGSTVQVADPVDAARAFATEYLQFTEPVVSAFMAGDSRSGEVEIRPRADGPVTTVFVRRLGGEDTWSVLGAATADIEVTSPSAGQVVTSPVRVQGQALAFEGNVGVEIRADGVAEPLGTGYVTGGGDVMRPFDSAIGFADPGTVSHGALVLVTRSMEDGRVWTAGVLRIAFDREGTTPAACSPPPSPTAGEGQMLVTVFFTCDDDTLTTLVPVVRAVPASAGVLRAALTALVAGPADTGLVSWFSKETAAMVKSVDIDDGHAVVDFYDMRSVIPNASSSAGSALLLSQLDATAFRLPTVTTVTYRINGSCTTFFEWLQGSCEERSRP